MNLVNYATLLVVLNTGKSMRFMMVALNRLINSGFGTNCMPPNASGAIL